MPGFAFALEPIENILRPKLSDPGILPPGHDVVLEVVEIFCPSGRGNERAAANLAFHEIASPHFR